VRLLAGPCSENLAPSVYWSHLVRNCLARLTFQINSSSCEHFLSPPLVHGCQGTTEKGQIPGLSLLEVHAADAEGHPCGLCMQTGRATRPRRLRNKLWVARDFWEGTAVSPVESSSFGRQVLARDLCRAMPTLLKRGKASHLVTAVSYFPRTTASARELVRVPGSAAAFATGGE
jgi:hypothetical protein